MHEADQPVYTGVKRIGFFNSIDRKSKDGNSCAMMECGCKLLRLRKMED
jgi:hypothetical protein